MCYNIITSKLQATQMGGLGANMKDKTDTLMDVVLVIITVASAFFYIVAMTRLVF